MAEKMLLLSQFPSVFYTKWTKLDLKDDATGAVVVLTYILLMGANGAQKRCSHVYICISNHIFLVYWNVAFTMNRPWPHWPRNSLIQMLLIYCFPVTPLITRFMCLTLSNFWAEEKPLLKGIGLKLFPRLRAFSACYCLAWKTDLFPHSVFPDISFPWRPHCE